MPGQSTADLAAYLRALAPRVGPAVGNGAWLAEAADRLAELEAENWRLFRMVAGDRGSALAGLGLAALSGAGVVAAAWWMFG